MFHAAQSAFVTVKDDAMTLVVPDILTDLCGLSQGVVGLAAGVGLSLWLVGWWSHRFWVVLIATVAGGIFGLYEAPLLKSQPLMASLLLALAAGALALALVRLLAFLIGGGIGLAVVHAVAPQFDQSVIVFLSSGLFGLVLFRWCITAMTSLLGACLMANAGLVLLHQRGAIDAPAIAERSGAMLTAGIAATAFVGFAFQLWMDRRRRLKKAEEAAANSPTTTFPPKKKPKGDDDFKALFSKLTRRAG